MNLTSRAAAVLKEVIVFAQSSKLLPVLTLSIAFPHAAFAQPQDILSVYFGLNDALSAAVCPRSIIDPMDGMPVVFRGEVRQDTLDAEDLQVSVQTDSGVVLVTPQCATLNPAAAEDEDRTVLLFGQFNPPDDVSGEPGRPLGVTVVGDLCLEEPDAAEPCIEGHSANMRGAAAWIDEDQAYSDGPYMVMAETFTASDPEYDQDDYADSAYPCPSDRTTHMVRIVFSAGVRKPYTCTEPARQCKDGYVFEDAFGCSLTGDQILATRGAQNGGDACVCDVGNLDCGEFSVTDTNGFTHHPFAFGDVFDGDNKLELCFDELFAPSAVSIPQGILYDPAPGEDRDYYGRLESNYNEAQTISID